VAGVGGSGSRGENEGGAKRSVCRELEEVEGRWDRERGTVREGVREGRE